MKMKVKLLLALTLLTTFAFSNAVKVRPLARYAEKRVDKDEQQKDALELPTTNKAEYDKVDEKTATQLTASAAPSKKETADKDVHKRGIYYNGGLGYGAHEAAQAAYWPKSYAANYGYSLNLPGAQAYSNVAAHSHGHASPVYAHAPAFAHAPAYAAHVHAPTFAHAPAYTAHAHAPTYAAHAPAFLKYPSASGYHVKHFAAGPAAIPVAAYGGGATFGHSAVGPAYATSAVASSVPHAHVSPFAHAYGTVAPAVTSPTPVTPYVLRPGGAVVSSYNVNYPRYHQRPLLAVPQVTPVQPVAHVHPVQPVQPVQPVHHVPAVAPVQPVQPVHSVVQTTFVQPQRIPVAVAPAPVQPLPAFPATSFNFSPAPTFPAIPTFPTAPAVPTVPAVPTAPAVPTPASNPNSFFPTGFQPPTQPQQTPSFVSIPVQPEAQFPPLGPLPGSQRPQSGSAEAAPQIPNTPQPQPELPALQGNEEPWKPILSYGPPSADRPALTLLPPHGSTGNFGSAPGEAYLPPVAPSQQQHYQQQYQRQQSGLFDNLSDSEIEHIFVQAANLAAQDTPHHEQHRTFSRY